MNSIKDRLILACAVVLCALQPGYAQESSATVRINYFNNSQSIRINIMPSDEVLKKSSATLENIEILSTYRSGNSFIISMPDEISPETLKDMNASFKKTAEIKVVENPTTVLISHPPSNDEITSSVFNEFSAKPAWTHDSHIALKKGYILKALLPDGRNIEALSDRETIGPGDWFKTHVLNVHLKTGNDSVVVKSFGKIFGGSGLLSDMAKRGYMDEANINIGMTWLCSAFRGLSFDATMDLWNQTKTHIYAFTAYDLPILNSVVEKAAKESANIPELVSSNIMLSSSTLGEYWKKYAVKEVKGVKIGFFFVMDNKVIPDIVGALPAELSDPVETAREMVKILVEKEKVDAVVMLAMFFEEDLQIILPKIQGVDIVINSFAGDFYSVVRTNLVKLKNWGDEIVGPAVVSDLPKGRMGKLQIEFSLQGDKKRLISILQESASMEFADRKRNRYDSYDDNSFIVSITSGTHLLPDSIELWSKDKKQYMPLEVFNLAAAVLNEKTKAEISLLKIRPFPISIVGEVSETVIRSWLQHRKIFTADLDGAAVLSLLKQIDFDYVPVSNYDWREKYTKGNWLAAGGVLKNGRVGGIPLNNNETYKVVLTEDLLTETKNFSALSRIKNKSDTGLYLDDIVIDRLLKMKKNLQTANIPRYENKKSDLNAAYYEQLRKMMAGTTSPRWRWRLNIKDVALQFSKTQVSNTQAFSQVPNSKLQASDQMFLQGSVRLALESRRRTLWNDTKVSMDYGKVILKPTGLGTVENEVADQMLFENEISYGAIRCDRFGGGVLGPLVSLGYNTEFTADAGIPKRKIAVGKAGIKLFEGKLIRDFHTAAVMERDFTFPEVYTKWAWETGTRLGGLIGENGPKYSVDISYKQFSPNRLRVTDLKREFELNAKLRISVLSDLSLNPFASFYIAKGINIDKAAHNYIFGISLAYSRLFKIRN